MKSTASASSVGEEKTLGLSMQRKIQSLEDEVCYLNKIISVKDRALGELDSLFKEQLSLSKDNIKVYQNMSTVLSQLMEDNVFRGKTSQKMEELRIELNGLSFDYVNYYQMEEIKLLKWHNEFMKVLRNVGWTEYKANKDYSLKLQNHPTNKIHQTLIREIPVQMFVQKSTQDATFQVDLLEMLVNTQEKKIWNSSEFLVSEKSRAITWDQNQIPFQINPTLKTKSKEIKVQEIATEIVEIREIPIDVITVHEIPIVIKRDMEIPIELQLVEEPQQPIYSFVQTPPYRSQPYLQLSGQNEVDFTELRTKLQRLTQENNLLREHNEELIQKLRQVAGSSRNIIIQMGDMIYEFQDCDQNEEGEIQIPVEIVVQNQTDHQLSLVMPDPEPVPKKILIDLKTDDQLESPSLSQQQKFRMSYKNNLVSLTSLSPLLRSQEDKTSLPHIQIGPTTSKSNILLVQEEDNHLNDEADMYVSLYDNPKQQVQNNASQAKMTQLEAQMALNSSIMSNRNIQLREIPIELLIQNQIEKPVYIPVEVTKYIEVPIIKEVQKIVEKQVEKIVQKKIYVKIPFIKEVPVEIFESQPTEWDTKVQKQVEKEMLQQPQMNSNTLTVQNALKPQQTGKQIYQIPVEVVQQRVVDRVIQVQRITYFTSSDYVQVKQTVEVQKNKYIPIVVEVPVQLKTSIQVQKEVPQVYQIPVFCELERIVEVEVIKYVEVEKIVQKIVEVQKIVYVDRPYEKIVEVEKPEKPSKDDNDTAENLQVKEMPLKMDSGQVQIEINQPSNFAMQDIRQIYIQFPQFSPEQKLQNRQLVTDEVQTSQDLFMIQIDMSNIERIQNLHRNESNEDGVMHSMLKVWEIPVQLQLDYNTQELQRTIERRYKEKLSQLDKKYNHEIGELHLTIENMKKIVMQLNQQQLQLNQTIQNKALKQEDLNQKVQNLQLKDQNNEQKIAGLTKEIQSKQQALQQQMKQNDQLKQKLEKLSNQPLLPQLPKHKIFATEKQNCQVQTDELYLFEAIDFIEIPVEMAEAEHILSDIIENPATQQQNGNKDGNQQEVEMQLKVYETVQNEAQTDDFEYNEQRQFVVEVSSMPQSQQYDPNNNNYPSIGINIVKVYDQLQGSYKFVVDEASSYYNNNIFSGIEMASQYQTMLDNMQVYQIGLELIPDSAKYGASGKQKFEVQTQTDFREMGQLPGELTLNKEESYYSYYSLNPGQEKNLVNSPKIHNKNENAGFTQSNSNIVAKEEPAPNKPNEKISKRRSYAQQFNLRSIQIPTDYSLNRSNRIEQKMSLSRAFEISIENKHQDNNVSFQQQHTNHFHNMENQISFNVQNPSHTYINQSQSFENIKNLQDFAIIIHKSGDANNNQPQHFALTSEQIKESAQQNSISQTSTNKNYEAFGISESSVHNITMNGEINIDDDSQVNNSMDINQITSANAVIPDMNYSDYVHTKDKIVEVENQRNRYQHLYDQLQNQFESMKAIIAEKDEEVFSVKNVLDQEIARYQEQLRKKELEIINLQKGKQDLDNALEKHKSKLEEQITNNAKLTDNYEHLKEGYEKLKEDSCKIEKQMTQHIQKLKQTLENSKEHFKEEKLDYEQNQMAFRSQIAQLNEYVQNKLEYIKSLQQDLQIKEDKLQQLTESHEELRRNIASIRRNQQADPALIYEQEFNRVKDHFQEQKQVLNDKVTDLNHQLEMTKIQNNQQKLQIAHLQARVEQLQSHIEEIQRQYSGLHHVKSAIETDYLTGVKQLQQFKQKLKEKQELLQKYENPQINDLAHETKPSKRLNQSGQFRIEYLSRQNSEIEPVLENTYITDLQNLILKYQKMLLQDQKQIEHYQEKVCEYLRDALEKEQEAEHLFNKLVEHEENMNKILLEKVTLQVQNRRLARAIEMSERKVQTLGTKMLEAMRLHYSDEQQGQSYYHYR